MNDGQQKPGLMNKACLEYLFSDVKQPRTVLLRTGGIYCDEKRRIIDEDRALSMCLEQDARLFLKVSSGSSGGSGILAIPKLGSLHAVFESLTLKGYPKNDVLTYGFVFREVMERERADKPDSHTAANGETLWDISSAKRRGSVPGLPITKAPG